MKTLNLTEILTVIGNLKKNEIVTISTTNDHAVGSFESFEDSLLTLYPYYTPNSFNFRTQPEKLLVPLHSIKFIRS